MAFDKDNFQASGDFGGVAPRVHAYSSTADSVATITASGYFNDITEILYKSDVIFVEASDDNVMIEVTSADGAATVTTVEYTVQADSISLAEGNVLVGNASGVGTALNAKTSGQILVGNGTTVTSVAVSGDATLSSAGAVTVTNVALSSLPVAEGNIIIGNASGAGVALNVKPSGQILVGDGTTAASVAVSGDATLASSGALTIGNGAVTQAKIAANSLDGTVAGNVADANVLGGLPVLFRINTAGGATADTDVTVTNKIRVIDAWVVNNAAGTGSDTITVKNAANAITDAIDISGGDTTVARAAQINDANHEIGAGGTLRITETDGAGSDSPATTVYVLALRVA